MQKHLDERVLDVIRGESGSSEKKRPEIIRRIEHSQCLHGTPGTGTCCEPARVRARAQTIFSLLSHQRAALVLKFSIASPSQIALAIMAEMHSNPCAKSACANLMRLSIF